MHTLFAIFHTSRASPLHRVCERAHKIEWNSSTFCPVFGEVKQQLTVLNEFGWMKTEWGGISVGRFLWYKLEMTRKFYDYYIIPPHSTYRWCLTFHHRMHPNKIGKKPIVVAFHIFRTWNVSVKWINRMPPSLSRQLSKWTQFVSNKNQIGELQSKTDRNTPYWMTIK